MSAVPFDTLKYLETLKAAGIPEEQAKALTTGLTEAVDVNLATKHDLKNLKNELTLILGGIIIGVASVATAIDKLL